MNQSIKARVQKLEQAAEAYKPPLRVISVLKGNQSDEEVKGFLRAQIEDFDEVSTYLIVRTIVGMDGKPSPDEEMSLLNR